ncbi:hypothetical protein [Nocardioides sp.]|uniref:hypothetical protein n=1 Tax=Nocardioides sp. TaxID=35761 RepID=UPI00261F9AE9|nr:hypothetical protein [Nocardioides sp.]MCW2739096.1 hypothetical protein [Nocardioides sp.]
MRRPTIARHWRTRVLGGALVGAIGFVAAVLLHFEPQPAAYVVMVVIVLSLAWLVLDTVDVPAAQWTSGLPPTGDRVDQATPDLRILTSHEQADVPSGALQQRLVALARARDPDLAETLHHEIDPARRLSPADIDRVLTRIEEVRDRS